MDSVSYDELKVLAIAIGNLACALETRTKSLVSAQAAQMTMADARLAAERANQAYLLSTIGIAIRQCDGQSALYRRTQQRHASTDSSSRV